MLGKRKNSSSIKELESRRKTAYKEKWIWRRGEEEENVLCCAGGLPASGVAFCCMLLNQEGGEGEGRVFSE
jgi:hypothetical protein